MVKNRFGYLLLLCIALYIAIMYHEIVTTSFVLVLLLYPLVLFFCTLVAKRYFDMQLLIETPVAEKKKPFYILLLLTNRSLLPFPKICVELRYRSKFSDKWRTEAYFISLNERCVQRVSCGVTCEYCGMIEFELGRVYLSDLLGLFRFQCRRKERKTISVLPVFHEIPLLELKWSGDTFLEEEIYSAQKGGDDPTELFKIREYIQGDRMNRVHWKLTAKEGTVMVKEFGLPLDCSVVVLIEAVPRPRENEILSDALMECAASLSMQMIQMHRLHFLAWFDRDGELKRQKIDSEESLYDTLAETFDSPLTGDRELLEAYEAQFGKEQYSNIFYLAGRRDLPKAGELRSFAKCAELWVLHITKEPQESEMFQKELEESDIRYAPICTGTLEKDIEQMFQ